ncbi:MULTISPECIES: response regulator transcription factor [Paraburkholderia]|uniref:response regulator transcription factor n=1 Tax=Paraburkholderia TaxID=1822464 RepID=UPI002252F344|nr:MULTISPECIES: response regulator [Paraburkholderia]MCX4155034.1 response regulator [Paraburkholderia aspalathi]MDN7164444.1 response regulator [Paraburkholderia sp. SECH2]MDQ6392929.1 response regulator [Paraburkholderia aspalathi]
MATNLLVCIVDDDDAVRSATESLVRSLGWPTRVFASAEEFLQATDIGDVACLISDVRMTGMSGIEMHERLLERGCAPPTIFVTAFPTSALEAKILANGALAFLAKPVDATVIAHYLARVCRKA